MKSTMRSRMTEVGNISSSLVDHHVVRLGPPFHGVRAATGSGLLETLSPRANRRTYFDVCLLSSSTSIATRDKRSDESFRSPVDMILHGLFIE